MGKTSLARRVAAEFAGAFQPGGTWFCDLSSVNKAQDLRAAVASILGIAARPDDEAGDSLARAIASRGRTLLLLDNLENVLPEAAAVLDGWLDTCPDVQFVVTSLVRVGIPGETCFELEPLEVEHAIALYRDRAFRACAGRGLSAADERAIAGLVERLDRIPLAIELAAARARALPPRRFLHKIDRRFELLRSVERTGRQGSLHRAISCSWDLLSPQERLALSQLSVFAGGFTLESAEELLGESTLEVVEALRDKSLLQIDESDTPRFSLYESVRAYAAIELDASGGRERAARLHAELFVRQGEEWEAACEGPSGGTAMEHLQLERENLVAAHRRMAETDPVLSARLALALAPLVMRQGTPEFATTLLDGAVEGSKRAGDRRLLLRAYLARAKAFIRLGRNDEARADIDQVLAESAVTAEPLVEGRAFVELGRLLSYQNRFDDAGIAFSAALRVGTESSDGHLEALARNGLGAVAWYRGSTTEASKEFDGALSLVAGTEHVHAEALIRLNRGASLASLGLYGEAKRHLEEAFRLFGLLGDVHTQGNVLGNLGNVALCMGDEDEAEEYLSRAVPIEQRAGNRRCEGMAIGNVGLVAFFRGDLRLADRRIGEGIELLLSSGDTSLANRLRPFLAGVQAMLGNLEAGRALLEESLASLAKVGDVSLARIAPIFEGFLELGEAKASASEGRTEEADRLIAEVRRRLEMAAVPTMHSNDSQAVAQHILSRAVEGWTQASPLLREEDETGSTWLAVGRDGAWFELPGSDRVDLGSRGPLRRMLVALAEQRRLCPGVGLGIDALVAVAWPGERILPKAAANRVYSAVRELRRMGLGENLRRHDDGYLLEPSLSVRFG